MNRCSLLAFKVLRELIPFKKSSRNTLCAHLQTFYGVNTLKTFSVTYYMDRTSLLFFDGYLNAVPTKYCLKSLPHHSKEGRHF